MTETTHDRWLHRYAVLTAAVALLPIGMGALVTTLDAGMAFLDWPTSDGQNMFLYPWLKDFSENKEKFVEHGHRLAGSLIGMFSIGLVVFTLKRESRGWVRGLAGVILAAVVLQGLLGGFRVIADARTAALVHGLFASLIFTTITVFALVTGSKWFGSHVRQNVGDAGNSPRSGERGYGAASLTILAVSTPLVVFIQSLIGGLVRHRNSSLDEHLGGAIVATVVTVCAIVSSWRSGLAWLRSMAVGLAAVLLIQLVLGAGAWVTRFGFPPSGYVAVQQAPEQILFRTAHTVAAMFVLMLSVQLAVRVLRVNWLLTRSVSFGADNSPPPTSRRWSDDCSTRTTIDGMVSPPPTLCRWSDDLPLVVNQRSTETSSVVATCELPVQASGKSALHRHEVGGGEQPAISSLVERSRSLTLRVSDARLAERVGYVAGGMS